jgi:hypothetical protein
MTACSPLKIVSVSEEPILPIFRVKKQVKQESSMKQAATSTLEAAAPKHLLNFTGLHSFVSQKIRLLIVTALRSSKPMNQE